MAWLRKLLLRIARANQEEFGPDIDCCIREALKQEKMRRRKQQPEKGEE